MSCVWVGLAFLPWMATAADESVAKPVQAAPASLIGLSRAEVVALRGKPTGERQRGETLVMVYPDGARIELKNGRVVAVSGGVGSGTGRIVDASGAHYEPGTDGRVKRPVEVVEPAGMGETAAAVPAMAPEAAPSDEPQAEGEAGQDMEEWDSGESASSTVAAAEVLAAKKGGQSTSGLEEAIDRAEEDAGELAGAGMAEDEPEESLFKRVLVAVLDCVIRFGLVVLVLRLALHFVGVPFFWPDLLKVCVVYLGVYEVLATLAGLGGLWEFLHIFKVPEVVSFIVLACSLTWFKIAGSGLTALKIAAATKAVVVGLMLAVGLAIAFGLSAMQ